MIKPLFTLFLLAPLALAACGQTPTAATPAPVVSDDTLDDAFTDDDPGDTTASTTFTLTGAQAVKMGLVAQEAGPLSGTVTISRGTSAKYANQVKAKLSLTYTGTVKLGGTFNLDLASAASGTGRYLISHRKNDKQDGPNVTISPKKNMDGSVAPSVVKTFTMAYGGGLNGPACVYLRYHLGDNGGVGPQFFDRADVDGSNIPAPLLCEPATGGNAKAQDSLQTKTSGLLVNLHPLAFAEFAPAATPAATLSVLPDAVAFGTIVGKTVSKQDRMGYFTPLEAAPSDPKDTAGAATAKKWAALDKALDNFYTSTAVYTSADGGVWIVGVNSWGLSGLKVTN